MGRYSTGICTTKGSLRIELSYLLKKGFLQKGKITSGSLSWTSGASISIVGCYGLGNIVIFRLWRYLGFVII